ncbi:MAG: hypothetical protein ACR2NG_00830, partial [Acidimicrobiia bacterium]
MATATDRTPKRLAWLLAVLAALFLFIAAANAMSSSTDAMPAETTTVATGAESTSSTQLAPTTTQTGLGTSGSEGWTDTTTTAPQTAALAPETSTTTATPATTSTTVSPTTTATVAPATTTTTTPVPPTTTTTVAPTTTTTQPAAPEPVQVTVVLVDHAGEGLAGGTLTVPSGTDRPGITTGPNGMASIDLLPGEHSLLLSINGTQETRTTTVAEGMDPVVFATGRLTVDFTGSATVYGMAASAGVELLPGSHSVSLSGGPATADAVAVRRPAVSIPVDIGPGEDIAKAAIYVTLTDSSGTPTPNGTVSTLVRNSKDWHPVGATAATGVAAALLDSPATVVRMQAPGGGEAFFKQHSTTVSFHDFATSKASLALTDHAGAPLAGGTASVLSDDGWHNVGTTNEAGVATFDAFPGSHSVSMLYNGTTEQRDGVDPHAAPVTFQTGRFSIQFSGEVMWGVDSLTRYSGAEQVLPGTVLISLGGDGLPSVHTQIGVEAGIDATATGAYVVLLDANGDPVEGATTKLRTRGNPSLGTT